MAGRVVHLAALGIMVFSMAACRSAVAPEQEPWYLHNVVAPVQKSVVTVAALNMQGEVLRIGSGFFIDRDGTLVTNDHVLEGAYQAEIKTADGDKYPIRSVVARNPLVDLMKVRVQIPREQVVPVKLADVEPAIADRVVVIGSPLGLEQTISEGIVSAVREYPANGKVYQLTAPTSPGSSGGPALNLRGQVIGVVTFQSAEGQNLNFAVSIKSLQMLTKEPRELSIAEWTFERGGRDPRLALSLCRQGAKLSIKGKYREALDYYQKAARANPDDPDTWRGLGSCYAGLDQPDQAIEAFHQSVVVDPDNAAGHFMLAMYFKALEQYAKEITSLLQVVRIDPENIRARLELAEAYGAAHQSDAQIDVLEHILAAHPNHVAALHLMGKALRKIARYDEALDLLRKASDLDPDNARIHFDIGVTYNSKNLPNEEMRAYIRAIHADPRLAPAHFNIAVLFLKQGNRKLALQEYAILKSLDAEAAERLFAKIYSERFEEIREPSAQPR